MVLCERYSKNTYNKTAKSIRDHVPNEFKSKFKNLKLEKEKYEMSDIQEDIIFITVHGLFRLVFKSEQQEACDFLFWVTDELLPELLEKGSYTMKNKIKLIENKNYQLELKIERLIEEIKFLSNELHKIINDVEEQK